MQPPKANFVDLLKARSDFDYPRELDGLVREHGITPALLEAVLNANFLPKDEICRIWAESLGFAYVDPFASIITEEAISAIPMEIAHKAKILGLYVINGVLTFASATPDNEALVRRIGQISQLPVSPVFALAKDIEDSILIQYSNEKSLEENISELERSTILDQSEQEGTGVTELADSNSVVSLLEEIIYFSIRERASDIHIEPQETYSRIRFRIDGMLREILTFSRKLHQTIIARLKVLASLNIAEKRFPQDGRFSITIGTNNANFRLSTLASQYGEKAVIRILASIGRKNMLTLEKMVMSRTIMDPFKRLIRNPSGIIFVTGPTGSGKTTTLYSALNEINEPDLNISTIEDPIEIQLPGITQTQVNLHIDLKFSTLLRSMLRQDPDVLLVGEIRDKDTAQIAAEAALTGHLVFTTLHTNSAPQAITRLMGIGVDPTLIAPSVLAVLAQRLAARICENCKEAYTPSHDTLRHYFHDEGLPEDVTFFRGKGCPACRGTGYKGRIAFHELLIVSEEVRTLMTKGSSVQEIGQAAAKVGYKPLRYDGLKKVLLGLTTIDEIEANTSMEWSI